MAPEDSKPADNHPTAAPGHILVVVDNPDTAQDVLTAADRLAALHGGALHLHALVPRLSPLSDIMPSEEVLTRKDAARFRAAERERLDALRKVRDDFLAAPVPGATLQWREIKEDAATWLLAHAAHALAIVLPRPQPHDTDPARALFHAAMFASGRPVLLVPPGGAGAFGQNIALAWRDDAPTARAWSAAAPFLPGAAELHLLAGLPEDAPAPVLPPLFDGLATTPVLHRLPMAPSPFGAILLAEAHRLGADMLVMGAYGHSELREFLLGGVTRHMLAHADLPLLMVH